ncbi:hypothetical protein RGUI_1091 [Rhodovulum sp. P5]|nr:hypothetical protein RGUI_1091 [Rhodovulum sp. P5]
MGMNHDTADRLVQEAIGKVSESAAAVLDTGDGQGPQRLAFLNHARTTGDPKVRAVINHAFGRHVRGEMTPRGWIDLYRQVYDYWKG